MLRKRYELGMWLPWWPDGWKPMGRFWTRRGAENTVAAYHDIGQISVTYREVD